MAATTVTLYTRVGCHLCDEAKAVIDQVRGERPFELEVVDVDTDPALAERYGLEVPVVLVGGRKAFKFRVDAAALRAKVEHLTPGPSPPAERGRESSGNRGG